MQELHTIALAYSGGLDTSVAVPWLRERYGAEVLCVAVDVGQGEKELRGIERKAVAAGAIGCRVIDAREAFVREFIWPTLQAGAIYSRKYLLGTAMARPLIARELLRVARTVRADAVAHGCTGKGNDQVRFELAFAWLAPEFKVIAPWRLWSIRGRTDALEYARARGVPVPTREASLYSRDRNLWHVSHEGGPLEDPAYEPDASLFEITADPEDAPSRSRTVAIGFTEGTPTSVDGDELGPVALLERLNALAGRHGIGRADIVEDRVVGLKSRGVYETPGGTLLYHAHRELEQLVLGRRTLELKDQLAARYAALVYEGRWWGMEREALDALVRVTQQAVSGRVTLRLHPGGCQVASRASHRGLYREEYASFEGGDLYDHADASGFIRLFGLPYRMRAEGRSEAGLEAPEEWVSGGEGTDFQIALSGRTAR